LVVGVVAILSAAGFPVLLTVLVLEEGFLLSFHPASLLFLLGLILFALELLRYHVVPDAVF